MGTVLLAVAVFAVSMLLMGVGLLLRRGCLTGSCGGLALLETKATSIRCPWCPRRDGSPTGR